MHISNARGWNMVLKRKKKGNFPVIWCFGIWVKLRLNLGYSTGKIGFQSSYKCESSVKS